MMLAAEQRLLDVAGGIESRYDSTRSAVEDLLASWKGIAPQTHRELWCDWDEGFGVVESALTDMAHKIGAVARSFAAVDGGGEQ